MHSDSTAPRLLSKIEAARYLGYTTYDSLETANQKGNRSGANSGNGSF